METAESMSDAALPAPLARIDLASNALGTQAQSVSSRIAWHMKKASARREDVLIARKRSATAEKERKRKSKPKKTGLRSDNAKHPRLGDRIDPREANLEMQLARAKKMREELAERLKKQEEQREKAKVERDFLSRVVGAVEK